MNVAQRWCTSIDDAGWLAHAPVGSGSDLWIRADGQVLRLRFLDGQVLERRQVDPSQGRGIFFLRADDMLYTDAADPLAPGRARVVLLPLAGGDPCSLPLGGGLVNDTGWTDGETVLLCVPHPGAGMELVELRGELMSRRSLALGGFRAVGHGEGAFLVAQKSAAGCGLYQVDRTTGETTVCVDERVLALEATHDAGASVRMVAGGGFALDLWRPEQDQPLFTTSVHEWHLALDSSDAFVAIGQLGALVPALLDARTGHERWRADPVERVRNLGLAGPCALVQTALHLHLLDRASGRHLATLADAGVRACWQDGLLVVGGMGRVLGLEVG